MLGMQSVGSQSPRGTDTLLWNDIESKRRNGANSTSTTYNLLTRRFTTFTSTTTPGHDHKGQILNADDSMRQIKLKIINNNPMIFRMLREHLIAHACFTDVTVSHRLNQFLNVKLRIPELQSDITNHQLCYTQRCRNQNSNATTSSMFFAYLTGESFSPSSSTSPSSNNTPNQQISSASLSRSVSSDSSYSIASTTSEYSQELSLPSLQSFGRQIATTQSDDMVSC